MLKYVIRFVLENAPEEMNFFNQFVDKGLLERLHNVVNSEFGHITYTEAVKLLEEHNDQFEYKVSWGCDLQTEHERFLTEQVFQAPGIRHGLPQGDQGLLYEDEPRRENRGRCGLPGARHRGDHRRQPEGGRSATSWSARMDELGLKKEDYGFYLDLRRYGSARHAGFGLGFERCVMYLTGMSNIRDVIPFPRTVNNCEL